MASEQDVQERLKSTLNLPKTDFPIRPNAKEDDPAMLARWQQEGLYEKAYTHNSGKPKYILHDGPPYANGNIHLGHAYNKILKDIITKAYRMAGYHVPVKPGWDCHGLPIELKVVQQSEGLSPLEIKQACRAYANKWIDIQRQEFKRLGVLMQWDKPYITMDFAYEAATLRAFGTLVRDGFIERKNKTVAWCPTDATTLASAEIEYQERKDPSIYVKFTLTKASVEKLFPKLKDKQVSMLVWTTTPWTLPLNRAVAVRPKTEYQLIKLGQDYIILGAARVAAVAQLVEQPYEIIEKFSADLLVHAEIEHPIVQDMQVPIIEDDSVGIDEGTACVHIAPGCGPADYEMGVKHGLEIYCPVDAKGRYSHGIEPDELVGMSVADGQIWAIKQLAATGKLWHKTSIRHSYPHCWRCHNGLIFRATPQWFFDLEREGIKERALEAVEQINFIPERGKNFLRATIEHRWEWCLSRQRVWGVPIPALLCKTCDTAYITPELVERVAQQVDKQGIEFWDSVSVEQLAKHIHCKQCGGAEFKKEHDILDVWFDSGVSHYAVLYHNPELSFPADLYLEGVDQYRGWYQSSLLTSLVLEQKAAMRTIISHGFTVDEQGRKMSKSVGNIVAPQQLIDKLGTDGLRLWVASIGHASDIVVSEKLLQHVSEVFRKVRNTCRFLLQNLYDFDHTRDRIALEKLGYVDRIALVELANLERLIRLDYETGDVTGVFHKLADYCTVQLSALYLDVIKDRLYTDRADGFERRSAQTVVWCILDTLTKLIAPIFSFTAEQISDHYERNKQASIHLQQFADLEPIRIKFAPEFTRYHQEWPLVLELRSAILKAIELKRETGLIKHPLEASVKLMVTPEFVQYKQFKAWQEYLIKRGESAQRCLQDLCIVSELTVSESAQRADGSSTLAGIAITVAQAQGTKCPRCWRYQVSTHKLGLCDRCAPIVHDSGL